MTHVDFPDHWVYVCRDPSGRPLYVGVTSYGLDRFRRGHSRGAAWWPLVDTIDIKHFDTRSEALERERYLIDTLKPMHNIAAVELEGEAPDPDSTPTNWLKIGQLAGWMGVSVDEVTQWMDRGMPHMLLDGTPRFRAAKVRDWLKQKGELE